MKTVLARPFSALRLAARVSLTATSAMPLVLGGSALLLPLSMTACADENDPATWVKRLDDPSTRVAAIKRLSQFFDDGMNKANKNREDAGLKQLLATIVDPLAKQYTAGTLDEKTRRDLIKLLADTRDVKALPAFTKAFNDYESGKEQEEDVRWSAQAVTAMAKDGKLTDTTVIDAVWNCFSKYKPSKTNVLEPMKELQNAVLTIKHPSYGQKAVDKLAVPIKDPKDPVEQKDQIMHWQATSLRLIGELKYTPAAKAVVGVVLSKNKSDLAGIATNVLMKMPVAAEPFLIAGMNGSDPELKALAAEWGADAMYIGVLADKLAYISRPAGKVATLDALSKATNDSQRAVLAQSLIRYPTEKATTDAFTAAYTKIPQGVKVALFGEFDAHSALCQAAPGFYDSSLVPWLLKEIAAAKGDEGVAIHGFALEAAVKLMTPAQAKDVAAAVGKVGTPVEKTMLTNATLAVDKCKEDAACYVAILDEPIGKAPLADKYKAVKATWMAAIYGNDKTKTDLIAKLDKVKDGDIRLDLVQAIDHLAPKGDEAAAKAFETVIAADVASGNKEWIQADDAVSKVALKLRARALP